MQNNKNILFLTHIYPPAIDGGSKIINEIAKQLKKHGHKTLVITSNCSSTDDFVKKYKPLRSKIYDLKSNICRLPVYKLHRRLPKPIFKFIPLFKTLVQIFKFKPQFIITGPFPTTISLYALLISRLTASKLIILPCFHQFDPEFSQKHLTYCLQHANLILTLTNHEKNHLQHNYQPLNTKYFLLRAGINQNLLSQKIILPQNPNILFLGNFSAHKRTELLISAFLKLLSLHPNLTLTLAGQKTLYSHKIEKCLINLPFNIKKNIFYYPKKYNPATLKKYIDNSTILVLPSIHESFGLVFIESLARHKPAIGANIPPVKELLKLTGGGLVFKKDNKGNLIKKINILLTNKKLYQKLSKNGFNYVKNNLTWDRIGDKLCKKLSL